MERVVLRIAAEIGEIFLWTHSAGITTNLIVSSSPRKRTAGKAIKIRFNHWRELWSLSKGRRTFEIIFSILGHVFVWSMDKRRRARLWDWVQRDPIRYKLPDKMPFSRDEKECFSVEVGKLLGEGAMRRASFDTNQFLLNQFTIRRKATNCALLLIWNHWTILWSTTTLKWKA